MKSSPPWSRTAVHPAREAHRLARRCRGRARRRCGCGRDASWAPRGKGLARIHPAPRALSSLHQPRRHQPAQRVADEEPPPPQVGRAAAPPPGTPLAPAAPPAAPRAAAPRRSGGVTSPSPRSRKTLVIVPSATSPRSFRNTASSTPAGSAARAASCSGRRVDFTPSHGSPEASRAPATTTVQTAFAAPERRRRHRHRPVQRQRQPHPQRLAPRDRRQRPLHRRPVDRDPERRRRRRQPRQMRRQPHEPRPRLPAEGLDQPQVGGSGAAKRAFHRASSYSAAAVESATTPPPTFSTASPSG